MVDMYFGFVKPDKLNLYKCAPTTGVDMLSKYIKAFPVVLRNQLINCICLNIFEYYHSFHTYPETAYLHFVLKLFGIYIVTNLLFTVTHYWYHKYAYFIHKTHHEFTNPVCIATEYNSVIEQLINFSYLHITFYIFSFSYNELIFVLFVLHLENILNHSGYNMRKKTVYHNIHHQKSTKNYASATWLEFLFE